MNLELKHQKTKTLTIKENGRSSRFVTPNFLLGCNAGCSNSYCYTRRFGRKYIYVNTNVDEILNKIKLHSESLPEYIPDQTDQFLYTYDIGCDTDLIFHKKELNWKKIFDFFNSTPKIKATFATKFTSKEFADYKVIDEKLRIRFSMMPQHLSDILEPNTTNNIQKLKYIQLHKNNGWDVHINLSPIIITDTWLQDYDVLLKQISEQYSDMLFEVIFATHNKNLHEINLSEGRHLQESYLWKPEIQETKISQYGGENLRYQWQLKNIYIEQFKEVFSKYFNINQIRYIF